MVKEFIMLASVLLWSGCIVAISFMESWLKFRAPGVSVPVGLGIGKLIFNTLNKIEWLFAAVLLSCYFFKTSEAGIPVMGWFAIAMVVLMAQTFWLLPALDARADEVIAGKMPPPSALHWYFVAGEIIKFVSLLLLGFQSFKGFVSLL